MGRLFRKLIPQPLLCDTIGHQSLSTLGQLIKDKESWVYLQDCPGLISSVTKGRY